MVRKTRSEQTRPVLLLAVHGRNDTNVPLEGGYGRDVWNTIAITKELGRLPVPDWRRQAALRNGCDAEPVIEPVADGVEHWRWPCSTGADVEFLLHSGAHSWTSGTSQLRINDLIWEFFERHPMPE